MKKRILIAGMILACASVSAVIAAEPAPLSMPQQCAVNGQNYQAAVEFIKQLKVALNANDAAAFAKLGNYPVRINQGDDIHYTVKSVQDMMIRYPVIMTQTMKTNILAQQSTDIFCNDEGSTTGKGEIWFDAQPTGALFFVINTMQAGS